MTARLIWITGRAAAGKSTVVAELVSLLRARGVHPAVHVDEAILLDLVRADVGHQHHWHPGADHRIAFRSGHLFDESLRVLNRRLVDQADRGGVAVVELARGCHTPPVDVTYRRALDLLDGRLWACSTVFRLAVDFGVQLDRNAARRTGTGHGTPVDVMEALYRADDPESFTRAGVPITELPSSDPPPVNAARVLAALNLQPSGTQHVAGRRVVTHHIVRRA